MSDFSTRLLVLLGVCASLACGSSHSADAAVDTPVVDTPTVDTPTLDTAIDSTGCMALRPGTDFTGLWSQVSRIECGSGDLSPDTGIQELNLTAGSVIEVTWTPFETYKDYWGSYAFSEEGGMHVTISGGNYVPEDVDADGCVFVDAEDRLVLSNMYLGTSADGGSLACGHVFVRR